MHPQGRYAAIGYTPKIVFGAKSQPTVGPYRFLNPPAMLFQTKYLTWTSDNVGITKRAPRMPLDTKRGIAIDQTDGTVPGNEYLQDIVQLQARGKKSVCGNKMKECQDLWQSETLQVTQRVASCEVVLGT